MFDSVSFTAAEESDRECFLQMSREFYSSPAVVMDIDPVCHEAAWDEAMRSGDYVKIYIFRIGDQPIGYGLLNICFTHEAGGLTVWIEELYAKDGYRGNGIGTRFLSFVEKTHPAKRYRLETEPDNSAAERLYRRQGYKPVSYKGFYK